jgi:hypothetical protein
LESILNENKNDGKPNFSARQAKETFESRWKDPLTAWMTPITNVSTRPVARITEPRLRRLVQKKSSSSAPGPDEIGYQFYKMYMYINAYKHIAFMNKQSISTQTQYTKYRKYHKHSV